MSQADNLYNVCPPSFKIVSSSLVKSKEMDLNSRSLSASHIMKLSTLVIGNVSAVQHQVK